MSSGRPPDFPGGGGGPFGPGDLPIPGRGDGDDDEQAPLPGEDDPVVLLDTELDDGKLWIVLANPGDRTAFEVRVDFAGSLKGPGGEGDLTEKRLFRGLPLLRPRSRIRVFVDVARRRFAGEEETAFQARVSWRSRRGEPFAQTFRHDLALWEDFDEVI